MGLKKPADEFALMARGVLALFRKSTNVQSLIDADHALELSRNDQLRARPPEVREQRRREYAKTLKERIRLLRQSVFLSFIMLGSAVVLGFLLTPLISPLSAWWRGWLGIGSIFCFAWATLARLGWPGRSWGKDSVIERLDERIFKLLYWIATLVGVLALL